MTEVTSLDKNETGEVWMVVRQDDHPVAFAGPIAESEQILLRALPNAVAEARIFNNQVITLVDVASHELWDTLHGHTWSPFRTLDTFTEPYLRERI